MFRPAFSRAFFSRGVGCCRLSFRPVRTHQYMANADPQSAAPLDRHGEAGCLPAQNRAF
jgi:hypothetical protein